MKKTTMTKKTTVKKRTPRVRKINTVIVRAAKNGYIAETETEFPYESNTYILNSRSDVAEFIANIEFSK